MNQTAVPNKVATERAQMQEFLDDCCEFDPTGRIEIQKLFRHSNVWRDGRELPALHSTKFGKLLAQLTRERVRPHRNKQGRFYSGIRLKSA